tara:strand:+ start:170 stop:607 length:438 start_codon:yes stop_codon:yes gene_type:complete
LIGNVLNRKTSFAFQSALPDRTNAPASIGKGQILFPVALDILRDLLLPETLVALRPAEQVAIMAVPETSMNENHGAAPGEYKIWLPRQVFPVQSKTEAAPVKCRSDHYFRLGVLALDTSHHPVAYGWSYAIGAHISGRNTWFRQQ